jgi:hypothetical protein
MTGNQSIESEPWQQRLHDEMKELSGRLERLRDFIATTVYENLPELDRFLLDEQLLAMERYQKMLRLRIELTK